MAEEDVKSGCRQGDRSGKRADPENDRGPVLLQKMAEKSLREHLTDVILCIMDNIRAKHLPSVKLLVDLSARIAANEEISEKDYESFSETLVALFNSKAEELEEQETGNREQGTGNRK